MVVHRSTHQGTCSQPQNAGPNDGAGIIIFAVVIPLAIVAPSSPAIIASSASIMMPALKEPLTSAVKSMTSTVEPMTTGRMPQYAGIASLCRSRAHQTGDTDGRGENAREYFTHHSDPFI